MIVSVNQPCYLPWCGLIERIDHADVHVHLDDVQYSKNTFFNRNRVIDRKGREILLTVPVRAQHSSTFLDVAIVDDGWREKHARALAQAYGRIPGATGLLEPLLELLKLPYSSLAELNIALTDWILATLGVSTRVLRSSGLDKAGTATDRLVAMCVGLEATQYYSPSAARDYLEGDRFAQRGITLAFQQYSPSPYPQDEHPFVPSLSVIDPLLRFGATETLRIIRAGAHR